VARDGSNDPDKSDSDPTQYANYGGTGGEAYSDYQQTGYEPQTGYGDHPPPEPTPWYRKPVALVGLGVLTAVIMAFLVYAVVKFTGSGGSSPAGTTTTSPSTSTTAATSASVAPEPGGTTQTVTQSPTATTPTSEAPTTTTTESPVTTTTEAPSTSTSTSISTSVSTVTETVTTTQRVLPTFTLPRPGGGQ
jgi:hypothetical protein